MRQELIRDKFVFGLTDDSLKERLLRETPLTLSKAIEIAQRSEASKQQIKDMKSSSRPNVDALKGHRGPIPTYCGQCGQTHKPKECSAYGLAQFAKNCTILLKYAATRNPYQGRSTAPDHREPTQKRSRLSN